jgi:hypothetical protein
VERNLSEQFEYSHLILMRKGIELFNAQKYWECHEEFEHHWLEEPGPNRNVYWAVIQVAAAMIHYRNHNLIGARGLIYKAKQKFDRVEKLHVENDLIYKELDWKNLKHLVLSVPSEPVLEDFQLLYEFRFKDPEQWK